MENRLIGRGVLWAGARSAACAALYSRGCLRRAGDRAGGRVSKTPASRPHTSTGVHEHGAELFSRGVQASTSAWVSGVLAFGVAIGALLAVVFVVAHGRV